MLVNSSQIHPSFSLLTPTQEISTIYGHTQNVSLSTNIVLSTSSVVENVSRHNTPPSPSFQRCSGEGGCRKFISRTCSIEVVGWSKNKTFTNLTCRNDVEV